METQSNRQKELETTHGSETVNIQKPAKSPGCLLGEPPGYGAH